METTTTRTQITATLLREWIFIDNAGEQRAVPAGRVLRLTGRGQDCSFNKDTKEIILDRWSTCRIPQFAYRLEEVTTTTTTRTTSTAREL